MALPVVFSKENGGGNEISVFTDDFATSNEVMTAIARLKACFPKMQPEFFNILAERILDTGFTGERLKSAVNSVIDGFKYKDLNVSDIIQFDKRVKLYTYNEVCNLVTKGQANFSDFEIRTIGDKTFRVKKSDLI